MPERVGLAPDAERVVRRLKRVFAELSPNLWDQSGTPNAAPHRYDFLAELRRKDIDSLGDEDLDLIMFRVMTTLGDVETFKYFLPPFVRAVLCNPGYAWISEGHVLMGKVEKAEVDRWAVDQRHATAAAMALVARTFIAQDESWGSPADEDWSRLLAWSSERLVTQQ